MSIKFRTLLPREREFIDLIVVHGLTREEAYSKSHAYPLNEDTLDKIKVRASALFYRPHVNDYYHTTMQDVRDIEIKKAVWTKEVAVDKLTRLIQRAEADLYGKEKNGQVIEDPKPITMSRLNAIMLPVKELNQMHGYNMTNMNVDGMVVNIVGEEQIPD